MLALDQQLELYSPLSGFLKFPTDVYIEPTNDCNLSCIMCPRKKSQKAVGYMSFELFRNLVDQLSRHDIAQLTLHLAGEPLLHPRIAEMVAYAKGCGLRRVRFATNATLLDESLARDLIEAGLDSLTVSMDASCAKRYCPGLSGHELIADLDQKILRLIALRDQRGLESPEVHMRIINMESTQDLIDDFMQRWEGVADRVTVQPLLSWAGHIKVPGKELTRRLICISHLTQGVVLWDGDVSFCCLYIDSEGDEAGIIGNAVRTSLEGIFLGERRRALVETQLRGNYAAVPYCKECPDWNEYLKWDRAEKRPIAGVEA